MRILAKICGITTSETLDVALAGGASHVGLNFFPKSPRYVEPEQAEALVRRAAGRAMLVGLFVDADPGMIVATAQRANLDAIQLHGDESPDQVAAVARALGREVWKASPVRTHSDLQHAARFKGAADRIVYDAKPSAGSSLPGGNGLRFDWKLLENHVHPLPWALSGGLDPDNVRDAIGITAARMVDVSSGVESEPGIKNVDKIAAFLQAVAAS